MRDVHVHVVSFFACRPELRLTDETRRLRLAEQHNIAQALGAAASLSRRALRLRASPM